MTRQVWAIINVTPDSFFEASRVAGEKQIVEKASLALEQGAAVLDIGGMSTRPGHLPIEPHEEFQRLDTAMGIIKSHLGHASLSVDTYRSDIVAKLYDKYGDFIVNDISGGLYDANMLKTVGQLRLQYVMMSHDPTIEAMSHFFAQNIAKAEQCGIKTIMIDPGFGFGKSIDQNFTVLGNMDELKKFNKPIFVGISRKSMIFKTVNTTAEEALHGTTALHFESLARGARILRVHDTLPAIQTIKLYETYINNNQ